MTKRMVNKGDLIWSTPRLCTPGEVILVHMMWSPLPEYGNTFISIPDPPADLVYGFWAPVPNVFLPYPDPIYANCCVMAQGLVNLFQEDPDFCHITVLEEEYPFPWDLENIVALMPKDDQVEIIPEEDEDGED